MPPARPHALRLAAGLFLATVLLVACGREPAPAAYRLVDHFAPDRIETEFLGPMPRREPTIWRFDGGPESSGTRGWKAAHHVGSLSVIDGHLVGKSSGGFPVVRVEREVDPNDRDILHAIEVRLRVSAGSNLEVSWRSEPELDVESLVARAQALRWMPSTPIVAGDEIRTYTMRSPWSTPGSEIRHLLIRPTDVEGATFAIESVRLIFRGEHLAGVPSGVGWQGLSEIWRETLVSRAPEVLRFPVEVPERALFDLAIGTIENGPVTFRVGARSGSEEVLLLERTVTRPHRWDVAPLDLSELAGRRVDLLLSLSAEKEGSLGFWGSPVLRARGSQGAARRASSAPAPPRGVILIWADTLRADHLEPYGYQRPTSPTLARMAREGALFRRCVAQATWTKVSTPSLMTSLYPPTHGVADFSDRLPAAARTLAEVYRDAGYATLSMSSILFTGKFTNLHQGFEEVHEDASLPDRDSSKTAREYVDRLLPWLEAHREVPFFVFLHVSDPHDPYRPYPPYDTLWADPSWARQHEEDARRVREFIEDPLLKAFGMPTRQELIRAGIDPDVYVARDRDWYDGSIRGMDAEIARLLERLRGLGLGDDTLIVFSSDHGEEFLEHGRMFHGQSVYGELTHVPLILWGPGVPSASDVDETVQIVDVMPTLLDLSGVPAPEGLQGRSLVPLLGTSHGVQRASMAFAAGEETGAGRPAFTQKAITNEGGGPPPRDTQARSIVFDGWRLVRHLKRLDDGPEYELYDARADPLNQEDVAPAHPEVVERLAALLETWQRETAAALLPSDAESTQNLSREELERLRSLGYVQ